LQWFIWFLQVAPTFTRFCDESARHVLCSWTDASGEDAMLCGVLCCRDKVYRYCRARPDPVLEAQLLDRETQIAAYELAALVMILETFQEELRGTLWQCWLDSDVVRGGISNGSVKGTAVDLNLIVGKWWLQVAQLNIGFWSWRVPSAQNVADGPTRKDLREMWLLGAVEVDAKMPMWINDLWAPPQQMEHTVPVSDC